METRAMRCLSRTAFVRRKCLITIENSHSSFFESLHRDVQRDHNIVNPLLCEQRLELRSPLLHLFPCGFSPFGL